MGNLTDSQIRTSVILEEGRVTIMNIIARMASTYSHYLISEDIITEELMQLFTTAVDYGKLEELHQSNLYVQKSKKEE